MIWKPINHPDILPGYLISPQGYIKAECVNDEDAIIEPSYHSTNGYDFMLLNNKDGKVQLFPIDDIIAMAYISIPESLKGKNVKVSHINGDTRDISLDNLEWVEDIEEWRVCTYPGVKPDTYEVSSWGRVRNKKTGIVAKGSFDKDGYIIYDLRTENHQHLKNDNWKHYKSHRLIAWEYCLNKNCLEVCEVNHINGVKTCNQYKNLEIVSNEVNQKHSWKCGLKENVIGENSSLAVLSNDDVRTICKTLLKTNGDIHQTYKILKDMISNLTLKTIKHIAYKETWKHLSDQYFEQPFEKNHYFNEDEVILIIKALMRHKNEKHKITMVLNELKDIPGINRERIERILYKERWVGLSDKYFKKGEI